YVCCFVFFFQAEDGIRDRNVTGVQTCALPISRCKSEFFCAQHRARRTSRTSIYSSQQITPAGLGAKRPSPFAERPSHDKNTTGFFSVCCLRNIVASFAAFYCAARQPSLAHYRR